MALKTSFEKQTCSRCGGSGQYSYCQSYGSTCFKCVGKGEVLTKRGHAAYLVYIESLKVPLTEIAIGDLIQIEEWYPAGTIRYFAPVVEIEQNVKSHSVLDAATNEWRDVIGTLVKTQHAKRGRASIHGSSLTMVRKGWDGATKQARLAAALAHQETLTKTGAPRKARVRQTEEA